MKNPELIPMKCLSKDRIDNASLIFTKEDELRKIFNECRFNFTIQLNKTSAPVFRNLTLLMM